MDENIIKITKVMQFKLLYQTLNAEHGIVFYKKEN